MCGQGLSRAILLLHVASAEATWGGARIIWRIQDGFIHMSGMFGWLKEWVLLGHLIETPTDGLSSLVVPAQSDFINGSSGLPASQEVEAARPRRPVPRHWQRVTSTIFYQSKQPQSLLRFKGRGQRLHLSMGGVLKVFVVLFNLLLGGIINYYHNYFANTAPAQVS